MKKTIFIVSLLLIASLGATQAQNVFKKYGFKKEVLTLSKGKYQEIFKNEEVVQIGTVLVNTKTNKVVKLLNEDTTKTTYNAELSSRFLTIDPLAEKYYSISPYAFCNDNPVINIDPDGMEWFYHSADGVADPTWIWHDGHTYNTGVKDDNGKEVVLTGTEAVVVFNGSRQEHLGTKDGKDGYINGEGAVTASVTVYGPDGADDIHNYTGYTMSSNGKNAIDEGIYNGNYDIKGKSGVLKSHWTLEHRGRVRMMDGNINPNIPSQIDENGDGYKTGIFIHSSNKSGFAGGRISTGCLLIAPNNWSDFNQAMSGVQNFKVQVIRTQVEKVPLQGKTAPVPNVFILQKTIKL